MNRITRKQAKENEELAEEVEFHNPLKTLHKVLESQVF